MSDPHWQTQSERFQLNVTKRWRTDKSHLLSREKFIKLNYLLIFVWIPITMVKGIRYITIWCHTGNCETKKEIKNWDKEQLEADVCPQRWVSLQARLDPGPHCVASALSSETSKILSVQPSARDHNLPTTTRCCEKSSFVYTIYPFLPEQESGELLTTPSILPSRAGTIDYIRARYHRPAERVGKEEGAEDSHW